MRFLRVGDEGSEIPALARPESTGRAYDLRPLTKDIDGAFFASGGPERAAAAAAAGELPDLDIRGMRIGAALARPHAIYAIGLNYRDHAAETGAEVPREPIVFSKAPNSLCGPHDTVVFPPGAAKGDWEAELGIVIGHRAHLLDGPESAADVIAGYVALNDISEREFQLEHGGQWLKGKSHPTFNPTGPHLVTPDEAGDPHNLRLVTRVNGKTMQDGTTADMIFRPAHIVWYLSRFLALEPGDLINTGTPAGVGMGQTPPCYLGNGDIVEVEVSGLGSLRNPVHIPAAP
ncbi:fumarylacetoacetate hydrolase family protein [Yinghuangia aomiensis]|uniref:Fumarylacetoacetate hydrolase family protein n=1 Tax=Yinghuangia aomiensis TaxID=676205 RepID=A0ABP9GYW4_9ACTN